MSFFKNSEINPDYVNEDARTVAHNVWTRAVWGGGHTNNSKWTSLGDLISIFTLNSFPGLWWLNMFKIALKANLHLIDFLDKSYFNDFFRITPKVEKQLLKCVRQTKPPKGFKLLQVDNLKNRSKTPLDVLKSTKDILAKDMTQFAYLDKGKFDPFAFFKSFKHPIDNLEHTATYYNLQIPNSKKIYLIFFDFDSERIYNARVGLVRTHLKNDWNDVRAIDLKGFSDIDPADYTK